MLAAFQLGNRLGLGEIGLDSQLLLVVRTATESKVGGPAGGPKKSKKVHEVSRRTKKMLLGLGLTLIIVRNMLRRSMFWRFRAVRLTADQRKEIKPETIHGCLGHNSIRAAAG